MRTLIPVDQHARVAVTVVVKAHLPEFGVMRSEAGAVRSAAVSTSRAGITRNVRHLLDIAPGPADVPGVEDRHLTQVEDLEPKVIDVEPGSSTPFHTHPHAHEGHDH